MKSRPTTRPVVVVVRRRKSIHQGRHLMGPRTARSPDPVADLSGLLLYGQG
jgi:hypothetical protein